MRKSISILIAGLCVMLPLVGFAHGVSEADQQTLLDGGLMAYIPGWSQAHGDGIRSPAVSDRGDLLSLGFKDIVRFITAFTIGHSITLIFATYLGIKADEHLIDAVIALSVLYKGFENLGGFEKIFKVKSPNLLGMVFMFGLIHGFGLSTRLQSFDLGAEDFLVKILCFNVGVELGQIAALIPIVLIITQWQKYKSYKAFYKAVNTYLILAGIGLFIYQLYGYFAHL